MVWALSAGVLAVMAVLALRQEVRFAGRARLPMQFGPTLRPGWEAPRRVALWFLPALAAVILVRLALLAPDPGGALIAGASMLGGQVFYHWLLSRAA